MLRSAFTYTGKDKYKQLNKVRASCHIWHRKVSFEIWLRLSPSCCILYTTNNNKVAIAQEQCNWNAPLWTSTLSRYLATRKCIVESPYCSYSSLKVLSFALFENLYNNTIHVQCIHFSLNKMRYTRYTLAVFTIQNKNKGIELKFDSRNTALVCMSIHSIITFMCTTT